MLLNPFLQLGKLRQRPLCWSLLFPVTQQLSLFLLIGSLTRCPSPQARPVTGPGRGIQESVLTFALSHRDSQLMEGTRT